MLPLITNESGIRPFKLNKNYRHWSLLTTSTVGYLSDNWASCIQYHYATALLITSAVCMLTCLSYNSQKRAVDSISKDLKIKGQSRTRSITIERKALCNLCTIGEKARRKFYSKKPEAVNMTIV